ncbi:MAG: right-handed parallel beta-helix repeat-containing protein [Verrucomicrobiae bacterium]|nr:right-handed parallel beta-helix repeat-containing protein [Verrucomicrobiae bacterium]
MKLVPLFATVLLGLGPVVSAVDFHVAPSGSDQNDGSVDRPFATLVRARDAIRRLPAKDRAGEPVNVLLHAGRHRLSGPLVLEPQDSGSARAPVTWSAYRGERAVIDGGREIGGWEVQSNGRWRTTLPEVRAGDWYFRQLYVNGVYRRRAHTPNEGFLKVAGMPEGTPKTVGYHTDCQRFEFARGDLRPDWHNLEDVEVVVYHFWTDSHLPIRAIDSRSRIVTFACKAGKTFSDDFSEEGARYIVDNVREGLDQPGEWYLDRRSGVLEYLPMPGETPDSVAVMAPVAPQLIRFDGDPGARRMVRHVRFENLGFEHTRFELPEGDSNDRQGSSGVPAAIVLTGAEGCGFSHCRVQNLGTFAFEINAGSRDNRFLANEIRHIAAGGFRVKGGAETSSPLLRTRDNRISDNHLHHFGEDYPSAVGILLMNTEGNTVAHNHVHHGYYTAISAGWVWGYQRSISRDNRIEFNHLHDIGQGLLSDMGAIYTLGVSPGTVIRNNLIHEVDAHGYGGWGIYNDEGSSHLLIESNVVHHTKFAAYNIHYARELTVRNNIFALGRLSQIRRSRVEPHESVFFERNIVYWREGALLEGNWQDQPYTFHFTASVNREARETFDSDWNLFFNPETPLKEVRFGGQTWETWNASGKDPHSRFADPLFVDADAADFRLKPDSPAFELGFEPIDLSSVGPREVTGPEVR